MNIQFIYDIEESKYSNLECYSIYDLDNNDVVYDMKGEKSIVAVDHLNEIIYFFRMDTEEHWILAKKRFNNIIKKFISESEFYGCKDYLIFKDCSGGEIYYKYN